jgi:hypothetical protein
MLSLFRAGCVAFIAAAVAMACSGNAPDRPPELGNCTPTVDAGCKIAVTGSGGGGSPGGEDGGMEEGGEGGTGNLGCGVADSLITPANAMSCDKCIQGAPDSPNPAANCCQADMFCTDDCLNLLRCIVSMCVGNPLETTCIMQCTTMYPNGVAGYQGFADCLSMNCSPECPSLPSTNPTDF